MPILRSKSENQTQARKEGIDVPWMPECLLRYILVPRSQYPLETGISVHFQPSCLKYPEKGVESGMGT